LKASNPRRRIDLLCRSHIAPLFKNDPNIDNILAFEPRKYRSWLFENHKSVSDIVSSGKYDAVVDFTALPLTAAVCGQKKAPPSVGFRRLMRFRDEVIDIGQAYDLSCPYSEEEPLRNLMVRLMSSYGPLLGRATSPTLWLGEEVLARAKGLLGEIGIGGNDFLVIHPGAKWRPKQWPVPHWRSLLHFLTKELPNPILLLGGPGDDDLVHAIERSTRAKVVKTHVSKEIDTTAAIIKLAALCICNDSAPMHIAAAVGTRSIAMFGPVSPARSAPPPEEGCTVFYRPMFCSPCELYYSRNRCRRGLNFCMHAIQPEEVFGEVVRILKRLN
jgi:ADP-heptose:LPS heptosyltransferase